MDEDMTGVAIGCMFMILLVVVLAVLGVFLWGFIELIQWVTTK